MYWMTQQQIDLYQEIFVYPLLFGIPEQYKQTEEQKYRSHVKLAWVMKDGKKIMLGVHNENMKGYAMHDKFPEYKIPLEEESYDEFVRWCTTFDV